MRQMFSCSRGYTEKEEQEYRSVNGFRKDGNGLEAAKALTECHGWSRGHSPCPQEAQGASEREEIGPEMRGAMGFRAECCTDKGWSNKQRELLKPNVGGQVMVVSHSGTNDEAHMRSYICPVGVHLKIAALHFSPAFTSHQTKGSNASWKVHILSPIDGMGS